MRYWLCGRVPDLQPAGCEFESRPWILRTKVYLAFHPSSLVNEYQLQLGRQGGGGGGGGGGSVM